MSKIYGSKFPVSASLLQEMENAGVLMQSGDVHLRRSLETVVPMHGSRSAWFVSVGQRIGLPAARVKSLFYNRHCRLWGDELARITSAMTKAQQNKNENLLQALNAHADRYVLGEKIDAIKGEIRRDILEDIRTLLLELHRSGSGMAIRNHGQDMPGAGR